MQNSKENYCITYIKKQSLFSRKYNLKQVEHFKYLDKDAGWRADYFSINIFDIEFNPKKRYTCPIMYAIQNMYNTYYI